MELLLYNIIVQCSGQASPLILYSNMLKVVVEKCSLDKFICPHPGPITVGKMATQPHWKAHPWNKRLWPVSTVTHPGSLSSRGSLDSKMPMAGMSLFTFNLTIDQMKKKKSQCNVMPCNDTVLLFHLYCIHVIVF